MSTIAIPPGLTLPRNLEEIDAGFMTRLLRARGFISDDNAVLASADSGVGMTAGYFSAIKRMQCRFEHPVGFNTSFIAKAWPEFELAPSENIAEMFARDIMGYMIDAADFYPRPRAYLADFDADRDLWALVMEDACSFSDQKLHETEMSVDEVRRMIPKLVDVAVAWEGCHEGEKGRQLDNINVHHFASSENLAAYKQIMPGGAKLWDYVLSLEESDLVERTWNSVLGPNVLELFTRKLDAFYEGVRPENGATCTLGHGDLRGDNIFFCDPSDDHPDGWLTIDFQLLFRGPVPSDLAYLMNSGTVHPDVYRGATRETLMREFYDRFTAKTRLYRDYSWEQFQREYAIMATVLLVYYVGFGGTIVQAGLSNQEPARVELGDQGLTIADLAPDELRKRMWWRKSYANFLTTFEEFSHYEFLQSLPTNEGEMGEWVELPERLLPGGYGTS